MDACWQQRLCLWYWSYILSSIITIIPFSYFLFLFYQRSYLINFFPVLNLYAWEIVLWSITSFSARMLSVKHLFSILLSFFVLHKLSSIQSVLSLIHNYLYTLCSHYNHNSRCPIIDMCTLLHSLLYCSFPCLALSTTPLIRFMVMEFLFQLEGECMHYGIACDMITALCHNLLIWQKFFWLKVLHASYLLLFKPNTMDSRTLYAK